MKGESQNRLFWNE